MGIHPFELKFDPQTIRHLGLNMYSTLAPALAELVSNAYDADATKTTIKLIEKDKNPQEIIVSDNGTGLSYEEINSKFLVIGRNRRKDDGDIPSTKYRRLPIGKKGLGKLALFGLANTITITTKKDGKCSVFVLDWADLEASTNKYYPRAEMVNKTTTDADGTIISMTGLKRKTAFDLDELADSLSRMFIFDSNFSLILESAKGDKITIDNLRKYNSIDKEFEWEINGDPFIPTESKYEKKISGILMTAIKPLTPQSGLRGITLFSRGKLVNAPEFFSSSTSSFFYSYLTGWINVDFVDELDEDVISTNRQSINWDNPEMAELREFLSGIVQQVNVKWREMRQKKKTEELSRTTGIDVKKWLDTLSGNVKKPVAQIIDMVQNSESIDSATSIAIYKELHTVVPEYAYYHWRELHPVVKKKSKQYYEKQEYYKAFEETMKKYMNDVRNKSGLTEDGTKLMDEAFKLDRIPNVLLSVIGNYKKRNGNKFTEDTIKNVQQGQQFLSRGIVAAGRNPLMHEEEVDLKYSDLFSEKDCLDLLSLLSHLFKRLDNSIKL